MGGKMLNGERLKREEAVEVWKWLWKELKIDYSRIILAGSYRRGKETLGDIEIVIQADDSSVLSKLRELGFEGGDKQLRKLYKNHQIDLYITPEATLGAMLLHTTGDSTLNPRMRAIAKGKGLKLNQWGLWRGEEFICGKTEEEIFHTLGMDYIQPQDREFKGPQSTVKDQKIEMQGESANYVVSVKNGYWHCTCPHHKYRRVECKHIVACKNAVGVR